MEIGATAIVDGTHTQAETIVRKLKLAAESDSDAGGFYKNRAQIRRAVKNSELKCYVLGRTIVGFAAVTHRSCCFSIDILVIFEQFRGYGHGRDFAVNVMKRMYSQGAPHIEVTCVPERSEPFWRGLGFTCGPNPSNETFPRTLVRNIG